MKEKTFGELKLGDSLYVYDHKLDITAICPIKSIIIENEYVIVDYIMKGNYCTIDFPSRWNVSVKQYCMFSSSLEEAKKELNIIVKNKIRKLINLSFANRAKRLIDMIGNV